MLKIYLKIKLFNKSLFNFDLLSLRHKLYTNILYTHKWISLCQVCCNCNIVFCQRLCKTRISYMHCNGFLVSRTRSPCCVFRFLNEDRFVTQRLDLDYDDDGDGDEDRDHDWWKVRASVSCMYAILTCVDIAWITSRPHHKYGIYRYIKIYRAPDKLNILRALLFNAFLVTYLILIRKTSAYEDCENKLNRNICANVRIILKIVFINTRAITNEY